MLRAVKWAYLSIALALFLAGCAGIPEMSPAPAASDPAAGSPRPAPSPSPVPSPQTIENSPPVSAELTILLPDEEGYHWQYFGFAEYGHEMTLDRIAPGPEGVLYELTGEVYDLSDGESGYDFSLSLTYTVDGESLVQEKNAPMMMDTFDRMELIRAPLQSGAVWRQTVRDDAGQEVVLDCTIEEIEGDAGSRKYTVVYQDTAGDYFERREIWDSAGVVSYEKLYTPDGEEPVTIGYSLYTMADAVNAELAPYLPVLGKDLRYFGLAEYGHTGRLTLDWETEREAVYTFDGEYQDGTGDDSPFEVRYYVDYQRGTVTEQVRSNGRSDEKEINSKLHNVVILKLPIEEGAAWSHQTFIDGAAYTLRAEITEYDAETGFIRVRYTAEDVPGYHDETYIEERTFARSWGMTAFANLLPGKIAVRKGETKEQSVQNHMFGYTLDKEEIQ